MSVAQSHAQKLARLAASLREAGTAGIAFPGADLHYLLGAQLDSGERLTALVVAPSSRSARSGNGKDAHAGSGLTLVIPELEATTGTRRLAEEAGVAVLTWRDGEDTTGILDGLLPADVDVVVSADAPARHVVPLQDARDTRVGLLSDVLDVQTATKSAAEIDELVKAGEAIDHVHARMAEFLQVGRTERQVAELIDAAILEEGMTHSEFVIVGSGPNGADPHHEVSDRVIESGDVVVVDIGGPVPSGYHSDCTRTYSMGSPSPEVARDYAVLERAQAAARDAVRPGIRAGDVDAAARQVLTDSGLGELFVHRTGHGIGMSVHEAPYIVGGSDVVLAEGMPFSIEPGIYRRGEWGARLEDIVVVTADGCRALNNRPRGLTQL